jgi:ATP-binding cassette subfamily B protein
MLEPKIFQVAIDYVAPMFTTIDLKVGKTDVVIEAIVSYLDRTSSGTFFSMLLLLAALYLIISTIRASFVFSAKAINAKATEHATERLRNDLFGHIQRLPMNYFSGISTGELIQRSTGDIETIRRFIGNQLVEVLRLTAIFGFSSYWLFKGNVIFGFISICATPFIAISAVLFFKREQKVWQEHEDEADKLNAITQENIAGIRVVKAFAQEEEEKKKFGKQNERKLKVALNHARLHTIFWPLSDFLVHSQIILSVLVGGYMVLMQTISLGELVSFYTYIVMVAWPMRQVGRTLSEMGMALVAMDRIKHIIDAKEEINEYKEFKFDQLETIEFKDVWFKYPKEEQYALQGLNLKIEEGQTIVLLGPTGSGKSTLVKLLLRFYDLEKGSISVNGIDVVNIDKSFLRRKIGLVLQDAFLFTETLGGNISYAEKGAEQHNVLQAAAWSSLLEVETIFSEGYRTMVGEKGVTLSGGQKQRVSLARTLLQNPDILILDDVTSAVDTGTESEILQNIEAQWEAKTTLIISHRLTVVPFADKIVVMEQGKVSAYGSHQEVLNSSSFYKQIHNIQNILEREIDEL